MSGAPSAGTTCSLELSLPSPAGIWFKTLLSVGDTNTPTTRCEFRGRECGGRQQSEDCGIPTKPAGGLLSDIGKVAPTHGRAGALYRTALKVFNVPPWVLALYPFTGSNEDRYLHHTVGVEPTPRGCEKGLEDDVVEVLKDGGRPTTSAIGQGTKVCISTIKQVYRMLRAYMATML